LEAGHTRETPAGVRGSGGRHDGAHQAVYVARRALDQGAIVVREELLQLVADVDVDRLERAAAQARRAGTPGAYRAALSLYAGDLLPENRYDDWAGSRREELAELAAELADGADGGAAEDVRLPRLPVDASSFIGRDRELAELKAVLRVTRLMTLAGVGGVGKTRLALELARASEPSHSGGAVLVELASLDDGRLVPQCHRLGARRASHGSRPSAPRRGGATSYSSATEGERREP
jgi:hypothetical protein